MGDINNDDDCSCYTREVTIEIDEDYLLERPNNKVYLTHI